MLRLEMIRFGPSWNLEEVALQITGKEFETWQINVLLLVLCEILECKRRTKSTFPEKMVLMMKIW